VVDQMDLAAFARAHRTTGTAIPPPTRGAAADGVGVRSSRQTERRCIEHLAFRILAGNQLPDQ
jgi:hypothetical protein